MTHSSDRTPDRIRLPLTFDADRMMAEVQAMGLQPFIHYSVIPLRSPAHLVDPSRPKPPPAENYADGSWTPWLNVSALASSPCLLEVIDTFAKHTHVTLVRLLRLEAGSEVKVHTDPTLGLHVAQSVVRLTIPIQSDPEVVFYLNDQAVPMQPGQCWYLRLSDPHRITHAGHRERINMTIDVVPNDWLMDLLRSSGQAGDARSVASETSP